MRKYVMLIILALLVNIFNFSSVYADRSYTIDQVTIKAQIDRAGTMHVTELYTYTFIGSFEGTTRSIKSDVHGFKAYLVQEHQEDLEHLLTHGESLTVEREADQFKIYTSSNNETKHVLYQYQVKGSLNKYTDTAEITYDFFDEENETDLHHLTITLMTPEQTISERTHAFSRADSGELTISDDKIVYRNEYLKAGESTRMQLVFPASELTDMAITKDKAMYDEILAKEADYLQRLEQVDKKMADLVPAMWMLIALAIIAGVFMLIIHPNRYRGDKDIAHLLQTMEQTDPLKLSFLHINGSVQDHSLIAALFSLRRRGIVAFSEVPSQIHDKISTFRFTWVNDRAKIDEADRFLKEWLFSEEDEQGQYFLLESIIDNPDEEDSVREKKAKMMSEQFDLWEELVKSREDYQDLRETFRGYSLLSIPLIIISFGLFYYLTTIDTISPTEQMVLPIIGGLLAFISVIFSRNKWVFPIYYLFIIVASLIGFTLKAAVILSIVFFILSLVILLIIPAVYWLEEPRKLKYAMNKAYYLMAKGNYPLAVNTIDLEHQLECAIILGVGESFADQFGKTNRLAQLNVKNTLLTNPVYVTETLSMNNFILYSTIHLTHSSSVSTTHTTTPTGGGGAGAF